MHMARNQMEERKHSQELYATGIPSSQDSRTCHQDTPNFVWVVIVLFFAVLVLLTIILLVIIRKQHKIIIKQSRNIVRQRVFHSLDSQPEQVSHNEAIPLESLTSFSTPANDDYEQIDQFVIDRQHKQHQLPNTHTHTTNPTTYDNTKHMSNSDTAEQTGGSNGFSYYNTAHDAEDTTAVQQSRDMLDLSANHVEVPVQNHYQGLVSSGKSSGQGVYQDLSPDTRQEDRT